MKDSFNRNISYARVSITDRCNLRCKYCIPDDVSYIPCEDILRYEEILRLCGILASMGVNTIRVTGGEPLVRQDCMQLLENLMDMPGIKHVGLTTNATLLKPYVKKLADLKSVSINISLDTLSNEGYAKLTGQDKLDDVLSSIEELSKYGIKTKVNCVPIKGVNDDQIIPLAEIAKNNKINVRFIELMPSKLNVGMKGISTDEILNKILQKYTDLQPVSEALGFGPAKYYKSDGLKGRIGVISALSHNFCEECNRLRVTSQGFLRLCLHHTNGFDLRKLLRSGSTDEEIKLEIVNAVNNKPEKHFLQTETNLEAMSSIGG